MRRQDNARHRFVSYERVFGLLFLLRGWPGRGRGGGALLVIMLVGRPDCCGPAKPRRNTRVVGIRWPRRSVVSIPKPCCWRCKCRWNWSPTSLNVLPKACSTMSGNHVYECQFPHTYRLCFAAFQRATKYARYWAECPPGDARLWWYTGLAFFIGLYAVDVLSVCTFAVLHR